MRTHYNPGLNKIHFVLSYKDKPSEQLSDIFHAAMRMCCMHYPIDPMRPADTKLKMCKRCKGVVWDHPQGYMNPKVMKTLAKQLGIKVTVVSFLEKCGGEEEERVPQF